MRSFGEHERGLTVARMCLFSVAEQLTTMLVGEGAKLDVHGCKTVDMASSFGKVRNGTTARAPPRAVYPLHRLRGSLPGVFRAGARVPRVCRARSMTM